MKGVTKYLIVLLLVTSCVGHDMDTKAKSSHNSQATEIQKKEAKSTPSGMQHKNYVPNEIIVKFNERTDGQAMETIKNKLHLKSIRVLSSPNLYLMKILDGSSVEQVMESLREYEKVRYSEPNYVRTLQ